FVISRNSVIGKVYAYDLSQPLTLSWDGFMHSTLHFGRSPATMARFMRSANGRRVGMRQMRGQFRRTSHRELAACQVHLLVYHLVPQKNTGVFSWRSPVLRSTNQVST